MSRKIGLLCLALIAGCEADELAFRAAPMMQVSAGEAHSCAVSKARIAYCWGEGEAGQLGNGSMESRPYAKRVAGSQLFLSIDAGARHTCGVTVTGEVYCWGANDFGQLGTGNVQSALEPKPVVGSERFVSVSAGWDHTCALTESRRVMCWGRGAHGQLGSGTNAAMSTSPVYVAGSILFTTISAGGRHTCALAVDGAAYCWGANDLAQLGIAIAGDPQPTPVAVNAGDPFTVISAGFHHTCAVTAQRVAYCWGENAYGEMGSGWNFEPDVPAVLSPLAVSNYGEIMFVDVSAGKYFTCGRRDQGTVYCWGRGVYGQLGNGNMRDYYTPQWVKPGPGRLNVGEADVFESAAAGGSHACALAFDGTVYCWGNGENGQLGTGEWRSMIALPVVASE